MKDFAQLIDRPYAGQQKSQQEIRDTTRGKPEKPADYEYGKKLTEWDSSLSAGSKLLLAECEPMFDRIIVRLLPNVKSGAITLTDPQPLIGGCRKAQVLKVGPGRRIPGEWWSVRQRETWDLGVREWEWIPGYRRPMSVHPGETVLIGNWVDLEVEHIALCQEADVRGIVA